MGKGLKKATLETVYSRGPWVVDGRQLTGAQVLALYHAIPNPEAMADAIGAAALSDRAADRALQILRRAGLVRYSKINRSWERA